MDESIEQKARDRIAARKVAEEKRQQELEKLTAERDEKQEVVDTVEEIMREQLSEGRKELETLNTQIAKLQPRTTDASQRIAKLQQRLSDLDDDTTPAPTPPAGPQTPSPAPVPTVELDDNDKDVSPADRYRQELRYRRFSRHGRQRFARQVAQASRQPLEQVLYEFDRVDHERSSSQAASSPGEPATAKLRRIGKFIWENRDGGQSRSEHKH